MNKNKGIIGIGLILAIVLGIVVVGGGAYYLGTKKNIESNKVVENPNIENSNEKELNPNNLQLEVKNGPLIDETNYVAPPRLCRSDTTPWIQVLSPNGGETFHVGDVLTIKVASCNMSPFHSELGISEDPSIPNGLTHWITNDYLIKGTDSYNWTWTIPTTLTQGNYSHNFSGKHYSVIIEPNSEISNYGNNVDESDTLFTINSTKAVSLDMSSELARTYTTAFTEALKKPANFDGHYVVTNWGCGTGCLSYGIVDKLTGKAYQGPSDDYGNTAGYYGDDNFEKTRWSVDSNIFKVIGYTSIDSYKFENGKFTKIGSTSFPVSATNLKTYTNTKYGFSFQYPSDVSVRDIYAPDTFANVLSLMASSNNSSIISDRLDIHVTSPSYDGGREDCNKGWDNNNYYTHANINNLDFIKGDISSAYSGMNSRTVATGYCYTATDGNQYTLTDVGSPSATVSNIINSFKLIK